MTHFFHNRFENSPFLQCGRALFYPFFFSKIGLSRFNPIFLNESKLPQTFDTEKLFQEKNFSNISFFALFFPFHFLFG